MYNNHHHSNLTQDLLREGLPQEELIRMKSTVAQSVY